MIFDVWREIKILASQDLPFEVKRVTRYPLPEAPGDKTQGSV